MITGFNPTDMYAADHIRRVLNTFPGVFSGIGEFTIHKEFVSSKISAKSPAWRTGPRSPPRFRWRSRPGRLNPQRYRYSFSDVLMKEGTEPAYLAPMKAVFKAPPEHNLHLGSHGPRPRGPPNKNHARDIEAILRDPDFRHVNFDISWDETAKYIVATPEATKTMADLMQRYPDRFLFGTDSAAPPDESKYTKVFYQYDPLWKSLDADTSRKVRLQNFERIFDEARREVRGWRALT